jgi:hypothetical protein
MQFYTAYSEDIIGMGQVELRKKQISTSKNSKCILIELSNQKSEYL